MLRAFPWKSFVAFRHGTWWEISSMAKSKRHLIETLKHQWKLNFGRAVNVFLSSWLIYILAGWTIWRTAARTSIYSTNPYFTSTGSQQRHYPMICNASKPHSHTTELKSEKNLLWKQSRIITRVVPQKDLFHQSSWRRQVHPYWDLRTKKWSESSTESKHESN